MIVRHWRSVLEDNICNNKYIIAIISKILDRCLSQGTESQNVLGWKALKDHLVSTSLPWVGTPST